MPPRNCSQPKSRSHQFPGAAPWPQCGGAGRTILPQNAEQVGITSVPALLPASLTGAFPGSRCSPWGRLQEPDPGEPFACTAVRDPPGSPLNERDATIEGNRRREIGSLPAASPPRSGVNGKTGLKDRALDPTPQLVTLLWSLAWHRQPTKGSQYLTPFPGPRARLRVVLDLRHLL